jgi:predicted RNA binding protein YcfA (HicA-like mRNA interferase family)
LGKLRVLSGKEVCSILEEFGFKVARQKGSHVILQRRTEVGTTSVPVPLHTTIRRGTLLSIIRQSGLSKALFETES